MVFRLQTEKIFVMYLTFFLTNVGKKKKIENNIKQKCYEEKPWEDNIFIGNHHIKILTVTILRFVYIFNDIRHLFSLQIKLLVYYVSVCTINPKYYGIITSGQAYGNYIYSLQITLNSLITFLLNKSKYSSIYLKITYTCYSQVTITILHFFKAS